MENSQNLNTIRLQPDDSDPEGGFKTWEERTEIEKLRLYFDDEYLKHLSEEQLYLNKEELKLLYEFLKWQYISYENIPLIDVVKKIRNIVDE